MFFNTRDQILFLCMPDFSFTAKLHSLLILFWEGEKSMDGRGSQVYLKISRCPIDSSLATRMKGCSGSAVPGIPMQLQKCWQSPGAIGPCCGRNQSRVGHMLSMYPKPVIFPILVNFYFIFLWGLTPDAIHISLLEVLLRGPYWMPGNKFRSAICKANSLPTVFSLASHC